jgi:dihydrofolate reductase
MTRLRVCCYGISADGFGAGPRQSLEHPLGVGGEALMKWFFPTRTFQSMHGPKDGTTGIDDDFARKGFENIGAWIMGRNMFGPIRGAWPDQSWKGWWGENPPYHVPVFVLTHHARPLLTMAGGTVFNFVTGGIGEAYDRAKTAAAGKDVRIGGGADTIRQFLTARLIDEMHLALSPTLLGSGKPLFAGLDLPSMGYQVVESVPSEATTHVIVRRTSP